MVHACSPHLPARASPAVPCAPRSLSPACGLTSQSPHRWKSTRSTSPSSPWPPAASRRGWHGRSSSAQARPAWRASTPCPPPPPQPGAATCTLLGLPLQWCTYCGVCRCGGPGGGQGGLQPAHLLAVPLRHHRRWAVLGTPLPGTPRPRPRLLPPALPRVPPLRLPHTPAPPPRSRDIRRAAWCAKSSGSHWRSSRTYPAHSLCPLTPCAHSLYS